MLVRLSVPVCSECIQQCSQYGNSSAEPRCLRGTQIFNGSQQPQAPQACGDSTTSGGLTVNFSALLQIVHPRTGSLRGQDLHIAARRLASSTGTIDLSHLRRAMNPTKETAVATETPGLAFLFDFIKLLGCDFFKAFQTFSSHWGSRCLP